MSENINELEYMTIKIKDFIDELSKSEKRGFSDAISKIREYLNKQEEQKCQ